MWDLYEDLYAESEDARERQLWMISCIAKLLNNAEYSPFRGSIKIPKDDNPGNLSLYSVCNAMNRFGLVNPKEELLFHGGHDADCRISQHRELRHSSACSRKRCLRTGPPEMTTT